MVDEQRNGRYQLSDKWLPNGTYTTNNMNVHGHPERAMGLNNDVKKVFEVIEERGNPVLKISGEVYGGLTTKASYGNYHLTMEVKWGQKKWEPRLDKSEIAVFYFTAKALMVLFGEQATCFVWLLRIRGEINGCAMGIGVLVDNGRKRLVDRN